MSYQFIDYDGDKLWLAESGTTESVIIGTIRASREVPDSIGVRVPNTHAPALALAILDAAGYGKTQAAGFVRGQVDALVKQAEQEAEDIKVSEFRESSLAAIASVFKDSNAQRKGWDSLPEDGRRGWRARYQAARKHFQEEA